MTAPTKSQAVSEALHYFMQYAEDGEYASGQITYIRGKTNDLAMAFAATPNCKIRGGEDGDPTQ